MDQILQIATRLIFVFLLGWFSARIAKRVKNAGGIRKFIDSMYGSSKDWSEFPDEAAKRLSKWRKGGKPEQSIESREPDQIEENWKWCTPQHVDCSCTSCSFLKKIGVYKYRGLIWVGLVVAAGALYFLTR